MAEVKNTLWAFIYNDCIHESGYVTLSIHHTKEGAEEALRAHKAKALAEFNENNWDNLVFGAHEDWKVQPIEVLP